MKPRASRLALPLLPAVLALALLLGGTPAALSAKDNPGSSLAGQAKAVLAQTSGQLKVPGLQKPVTVLRDQWGIPHIYAETQDDLFFAQGFVAAQDRLWQMEIWRRTAQGELAEVLGATALERDRFARLLRYRGDMEAEYASYAPDTKPILEAFVRGINAYIELNRKRLPIEFQLTGTEPELWTPEVCLSRMAGFPLTRNAGLEVARAYLAKLGGPALVDELIETEPPKPLEIPEGLSLDGFDEPILAGAMAALSPVSFETPKDARDGSNNWVIAGGKSATGKPLLANDPHRGIALPSLRYLVHLVGPGWNVIGAGEPGLPGVAAGHNDRVAFGFTVVGIDQQDLYVEEVNPENPNEYRWQGRWTPMKVEREKIEVKGQEPVEVELKFTVHGPVVYEDKARRRAYALRWVGAEPGTAGYLGSLSLNRARNWDEFLKALERWKVPSENLLYADVDGNIGWVAAGITPVRKGWSGLMPVPGAEGKYEWQGFLPFSELPRSFNPAPGFIATANHNILPPGYPHELGYEWASAFRFQRIVEALRAPRAQKFTVEDFQKLQHDEASIPARRLTALFFYVENIEPDLKPYVEMLLKWNHTMDKDSAPAALFQIWLTKIRPAVFQPKLSEDVWRLAGGQISLVKTLDVLQRPTERWFGADPVAGRNAALLKSLGEAVTEAKEKLGADPAKWRWGTLHTASFRHMLSTDDARKAVLDLPTVERGGDANTVNSTAGPNFTQVHGASFREVLDVADWDRSVATSVPGQSGQPGSPHYGDLLPLWAEGRYFPLLYSRERVEKEAKQKLVLEPAK
jgi:penicillin amidase